MKCKNDKCDNEVTGRQVFCSDKCRKALSRTFNSDKPNSDMEVGQVNLSVPGEPDYAGVCQEVDGQWVVVKPNPKPVSTLTRIELQQAIRAYPNDRWVNSPEHKELKHRLDVLSVSELERLGYMIPVRKMAG